ncbi:MAG: hypothetical protein QOF76_3990 [Solirubrobacteraceae bacterium]|jgi:NAD(P)-dependent dehydrogenase (short-subunit alcohol dehydrogenase family)|nr:hypothetical protein [Solirubrobacteraceae bacterium]
MLTHRLFDPAALSGKRILITGGATGLGRGIAGHLVGHGAEVHLWGRRPALLARAVEELGERAHAQVVDLRDEARVELAVEEIWTEHGPLTGLVNNAAANFVVQTKDLSPRGFDAVTSTVMRGSFVTTVACGRRWIAEGRPASVVSNLTTWVWTGSAFVTAAAMAKTAVHAMTMSLAVEWARYGIRVNAVAPGPIPTDFAWEMLSPTAASAVGATQVANVPAGRFGTVDELGNLLVLLLSDGCDYLTGATIPIDGAQHLAGPSTFAEMTALSEEEWQAIRDRSQAVTAASRAQQRADPEEVPSSGGAEPDDGTR